MSLKILKYFLAFLPQWICVECVLDAEDVIASDKNDLIQKTSFRDFSSFLCTLIFLSYTFFSHFIIKIFFIVIWLFVFVENIAQLPLSVPMRITIPIQFQMKAYQIQYKCFEFFLIFFGLFFCGLFVSFKWTMNIKIYSLVKCQVRIVG